MGVITTKASSPKNKFCACKSASDRNTTNTNIFPIPNNGNILVIDQNPGIPGNGIIND